MEKSELYQKIQNFQLDNPNASFKFSDKLAKQNNWTKEFSLLAMEEYKKFMFLIANYPTESFTPSKSIDEVWHLHLQYTKSYWKQFCPLLGKEVHHNPSDGNEEKELGYKDDYQKTLQRYYEHFGTPPVPCWGKMKSELVSKSLVLNSFAILALLAIDASGALLMLGVTFGLLLIILVIISIAINMRTKQEEKYYNYNSSKKTNTTQNKKENSDNGSDTTYIASCSSDSNHHSSNSDSSSDSGSSCGSSCGGGGE